MPWPASNKGHQWFMWPSSPCLARQSPKSPHRTEELPQWVEHGPWAVDREYCLLFCLDYYYYYYFECPSSGENRFTERLNSSHSFELCDRQRLKIEPTAPPRSPFPVGEVMPAACCPASRQPVSGSVCRSRHGELKRLSGVGRSSAQRQERKGGKGGDGRKIEK